jgi:hypothetical protein
MPTPRCKHVLKPHQRRELELLDGCPQEGCTKVMMLANSGDLLTPSPPA